MISLRQGDCRTVLPTLADASVHCVVTSPPYWGLRDYGTATWEGGDPGCDHKQYIGASASSGLKGSLAHKDGRIFTPFRDVCGHCGAIRIDAQLGLEPDFNAYVASMVAVFREVRRVLRDDGTLWLNLGDSYSTSPAGNKQSAFLNGTGRYRTDNYRKDLPKDFGVLKPKDLCGIPWRVAFALQADGWYLRQDIIWSKPNPMPESVTDRCTKAHEYLFLLSKRERYYYDAEAIAEPTTYPEGPGNIIPCKGAGDPFMDTRGNLHAIGPRSTRNKRSVWEVTTQPFSEAHFATFPPALIEPCIKAGCPRDGTVLDPFAGAGTTGLVADRLQRNAVLIELNPAYATMAGDRITGDAPLFAEVTI